MHELTLGYRETVTHEATARGRYIRPGGEKPRYGDVELRVEPLPRGAGFEFACALEPASGPSPAFLPHILQGVVETMEEGVIAGFPLVDLRVILTGGSEHNAHSSPLAFRIAASIALHDAVLAAGPVILMPVMRVEACVEAEAAGGLQREVGRRGGLILSADPMPGGATRLTMAIPLPALLGGSSGTPPVADWRTVVSVRFSHYERADPDLQAALLAEARKAADSSQES
ncbi:MAG: hypothetical protein N2111_07730 [Candidatus Sumerlaeaceae bacterium]|nr:hypothetical protein [Candidatus Sumerlaeaceae bacterium]